MLLSPGFLDVYSDEHTNISQDIFRRDGSSNNYRQSQQLQASKEDLEHEKSTDDSGEQLMSNPRNGHGVRLRPVSNLRRYLQHYIDTY